VALNTVVVGFPLINAIANMNEVKNTLRTAAFVNNGVVVERVSFPHT